VEIKTKRDATQQEVDQALAALKKGTELRKKKKEEFDAEDARLSEAIKSAAAAVGVLSTAKPNLAQVQAVARRLRGARVLALAGPLRGPSAVALRSFVEGAPGAVSLLAVPGFQAHSSQRGQLLGLLRRMSQPWQGRLAGLRADEARTAKRFAGAEAAMQDQIAAGKRLVLQLDEEYAEFGEKHVQAGKELEDTKKQLELDRAFLATLRQKCNESGAEFDARVKSRLAEISAVEGTVKILEDDKALKVLDKTMNAAFLQTSSSGSSAQERARRGRAASVLALAAGRSHSPGLALLATHARLDSFSKVREEIDKMVVQLKKEQEDEVAHRDWCIKELNANNKSAELAHQTKDKLQTKAADLSKTIEMLQGKIEATEAEMAEMQQQLKRASDNRESENAVYQQTISDQRLTQVILRKALDRMKEVYSLAQGSVRAKEQPGAPRAALSGAPAGPGSAPARFSQYGENAGGGKVLKMLGEVIADAKAAEEQAMKDDASAQSEYEFFMKDTNQALTLAAEKLSDTKDAHAKAKQELTLAETDSKQTLHELEDSSATLGKLRQGCSQALESSGARRAARAAELGALGEARGILAGAS